MNRYIKDALFGAIGGVAATFVIGKVMGAISQLQSEEDKKLEQQLIPEQPTEKLARRVSENILGVPLENEKKALMGQAVYWGYGIFWGSVYGVLRNQLPAVRWGAGLPFGVAFGLIGPAVMLPLMDLTPGVHKFPLSSHARGLVSHYAYAATAEGICRACEAIDRAVTQKPTRTKTELRRVS